MKTPTRAIAVAAMTAGLLAPVTAHADQSDLTVTVVHPEPTGEQKWWTEAVPVHIGVESGSQVTGSGSALTLTGATTRTQPLGGGTNSIVIDAEGRTDAAWKVENLFGTTRSGTFTIKVDSVKPTAEVYASVSGNTVRQGDVVAVSSTCRDRTSGLTRCDLAGDVLDGRYLDTSRAGTATARAVARDAAGHETISDRVFTVLPHDGLPTATITVDGEPTASGWYLTRPLVHVTGTPVDGGADVGKVMHRTRVGRTVGDWYDQAGRQATVVLPGDGAHLVDARAVDQLGSQGAIVTQAVKVDTQDPRVDLDELPALRQGDTHSLSHGCNDPESGIASCELSGDVDPVSGRVDTSRTGPVTVRLRATDHAGRTTTVERNGTVAAPALTVSAIGPREVSSTGRATITVETSAEGGDPSRTVEVFDNSTSLGSYQLDMQNPLAATTGRAVITLPRLRPGSHTIEVVYRSLPAVLAAGEARASVAIRSRARTSASARWTVSRKKKGRATVKVTASGVTPRGTVRLYDGRRVLRTATLTTRGTATVRLPRLTKGKHRLRVRYLGSTYTYADWSSTRSVRVK